MPQTGQRKTKYPIPVSRFLSLLFSPLWDGRLTCDADSPEVQQWIQELEGFDIPDWSPTTDGTCAGDSAAAAEAKTRGWWTCGGITRDTDILACPKKYDWGVSFDDGPSPWSGCFTPIFSFDVCMLISCL